MYSIPLSIDLWLHYGNLCINQGLDYEAIAGYVSCICNIHGLDNRKNRFNISNQKITNYTKIQTLCGNMNVNFLCSCFVSLYDRSLVIAGYEFRSDLLWEAAIHYQETQGQTVKVFSLFRQLIATPTQLYKKHYQRLVTVRNVAIFTELLICFFPN